jgi:hypothetical protein
MPVSEFVPQMSRGLQAQVGPPPVGRYPPNWPVDDRAASPRNSGAIARSLIVLGTPAVISETPTLITQVPVAIIAHFRAPPFLAIAISKIPVMVPIAAKGWRCEGAGKHYPGDKYDSRAQ